jgi:type IV pilus assembly protein PilW
MNLFVTHCNNYSQIQGETTQTNCGFSLVELMISVALGLVVSLGVIQVMVSNRVTNEVNQTLAEVQESGRFVLTRIRNELLETGLYDSVYTDIAAGADITQEEAFVRNHPIILPGHLLARAGLGSTNGEGTANDQLVVSLQGENDCNGSSWGAIDGEEQHVVNHYYVVGNELRCDGYSGRILRGVVPSASTSSSGTVVLMDGVQSFQVQYGISSVNPRDKDRAVQYITADQLPAAEALNQLVVSVRIAVLIQSNSRVSSAPDKTFTVLDVSEQTVDNDHYGQVFSHTVALRNVKNYVRSL